MSTDERVTYYDRAEKLSWYGEGPWMDEPDRVEWTHEGFPCLARRVHWAGGGHWCGYVAVPKGHPWYGRKVQPDVHGDANSWGPCRDDVCHVPAPGEPDDVWWVGFDCQHLTMDISPGTSRRLEAIGIDDDCFSVPGMPERRYRTITYVRLEVEGMAEQARDAAATPGDFKEIVQLRVDRLQRLLDVVTPESEAAMSDLERRLLQETRETLARYRGAKVDE